MLLLLESNGTSGADVDENQLGRAGAANPNRRRFAGWGRAAVRMAPITAEFTVLQLHFLSGRRGVLLPRGRRVQQRPEHGRKSFWNILQPRNTPADAARSSLNASELVILPPFAIVKTADGQMASLVSTPGNLKTAAKTLHKGLKPDNVSGLMKSFIPLF